MTLVNAKPFVSKGFFMRALHPLVAPAQGTKLGFGKSAVGALNTVIIVLAVGLVGVLMLPLTSAVSDVWQADRARALTAADGILFDAIQEVRASRGASQSILQTVEDATPQLNRIRAETEAKLGSAIPAAKALLPDAEDALADKVVEGWRASATQHAQLLAIAAEPKTKRNLKDADVWYNTVGVVLDDLYKVSLSIAGTVRAADTGLAEDVMIRQTAWDLRESLGDECSASRPAFGTNTPLSGVLPELVAASRGGVNRALHTMQEIVAYHGAPAVLTTAIQGVATEVQGAFADRDGAYSRLGTANPLPPVEWTKICNAPLPKVLRAANVAIQAMVVRADDLHAAAVRRLITTGIAMAVALFVCVAGLLTVRGRVGRPLQMLVAVVRQLAGRDYVTPIAPPRRRDEFGVMAQTLEQLREGAHEGERLAAQRLSDEAVKAERAARLDTLIQAFESKVSGMIGVLSNGSSELKATAQAMSGTATRTHDQAAAVSNAASDASQGVGTVAAAAEELTASIQEISQQVARSAKITEQAVESAKRTDAIVHALSEAADRIGHVVGLIANIAGQTNLLALNATIEAARAGDAGKGFAVVASEVKSLASQTASATDDIGAQIAQIQAATADAVAAIRGITGTIEEVSTIAVTIAAAVEEQGAATAEIARNVQQTSVAATEVTVNIGGVSQAATETGSAASLVLNAATDLSAQTAELTGEVNSFLNGMRAA
jgi:methyl-accepting chemotaxis protein